MKQNILLILSAMVFAFGCDEYTNSAEESAITYLPKMEVMGEDEITLDCSATGYSDEGAIATEGGVEITVNTVTHGLYFESTSVDQADRYTISYSATNQDGIPAAAFREVVWEECTGDMVTSIAGMYTASVVRTASSGAVNSTYSASNFGPYFIVDLGGGQYGISDAIGTFYEYGYGYGSDYAAIGMTLTANDIAANDFTLDGTSTLPWGGEIVLTDFSVDPVTKTITFSSDWDLGYVFDVTLVQVP